MHERPQAALFKALRELDYRIDASNDKLPAVIHGESRKADEIKRCIVSIEESSQFASALLLSAKCGGWETQIVGENADESPYVAMTAKLVESFPHQGGTFQIEPDASSGSYFWAAGPAVSVRSWPESDWQIDAKFRDWMREFNASNGQRPSETSRESDLGDSIMTAIVMAPQATQPMLFTDLGRLRVQETERVHALRTELTKCGAMVKEVGDTLSFFAAPLHGAEVETYNDHRMAMCFAILGLKVPGIKLKNPACVKKTFPNFFQKLAAPAPDGLGVEIRHGETGKRLGLNELFAD
jgi:3-phosphoshikimate 1-carboxyvinyltransferase